MGILAWKLEIDDIVPASNGPYLWWNDKDTRYCEFSQLDSQPDRWSHPQQSVKRELHGEFTVSSSPWGIKKKKIRFRKEHSVDWSPRSLTNQAFYTRTALAKDTIWQSLCYYPCISIWILPANFKAFSYLNYLPANLKLTISLCRLSVDEMHYPEMTQSTSL